MSDTISFVVDTPSGVQGKGLFGGSQPERRALPVDVLQAQFKAETEKLLAILDAVPSKPDWTLESVEVGVEISAEAGVSFIGTATAGATASIKLTFKR